MFSKFFKNKVLILILAPTVAGVILGYQFYFKKGEELPYEIYKVAYGNVSQEISETGVVKAAEDINLGFRRSGKIERLFVKVGDKAIGAKNSTITSIFLIESGIIGLIGGVGGTVLGLGIAKIIEFYGQIHPVFYIEASISPFIVFFGLAFSFLLGCISGFLPARRAAKLKPVEALRYE